MIKRICLCYFSPCGNVKKIVQGFANAIAKEMQCDIVEMDFTLPAQRDALVKENGLSFSSDDLVVLGTPVYAGRIPNKIMPFIQENIKGDNSLCVCMASYGNRNFDDAIAEQVFLMQDNGMKIVGAAAVVSEHSFSDELACGRPNDEDMNEIGAFAIKIADKIKKGEMGEISVPGELPPQKYYTPLKADGQPAKFLKAVPKVDESKCKNCNICAKVCPMGSVDASDSAVCNGPCIKCQACIKACPSGARYFDDEDFLSHVEMLKMNYKTKKNMQFFVE